MPIRYEKLFRLLKEKGLTKYSLRKDNVVGVATLEKMRKGVGHIDTRTIEKLCAYLHCQPGHHGIHPGRGNRQRRNEPMNTANKLTILRVFMIPVFLLVLYLDVPNANYWALTIFVIASLTDTLDGYIARHYNQTTDFGKFMDPLAVKCLVTAAMLWFVEIGQMPAWALLVVIIREFGVSGLRMVAADKGRVIAAGWSGKVKTASTMVCIVLMFLPIPAELNLACVAVIVLTTIYSGVEYFVKNRDVISEIK